MLDGVVGFIVRELLELASQLRVDCFRAHVHLLLIRLCLGLGVGVVIRLKVIDSKLILSVLGWSAASGLPACLYTSCWNTSLFWTVPTCTPRPRRRLPGEPSVE